MTEVTTKPGAAHARGTLIEQREDLVVLGIPETSYQLHLKVYQPLKTAIGKKIAGTIRADVQRLDLSGTGGRYIEPVYGRPRRIQGVITAVDAVEQTVTINATVPFVCRVHAQQRAENFNVGDFVTCGVKAGAAFTPTSGI